MSAIRRAACTWITLSLAACGDSAGPGYGAVWFEESFAEYGSTTEMLADPRGVYLETENQNIQDITLDTATGVAPLSLPQALKYTFPDRTASPGRCGDYTIARSLVLPQVVQELWAEFYLLFPSDFRTAAPREWGCTSNPDYKLLFGVTNISRFEVKTGADGNSWKVGAPFNEALPTGRAVQEWDGQWHRYRVHWKLGNGSGTVAFWIDDTLIFERTNLDTQSAPGIARVRLGGNLNQGPAAPMPYWWGRVQVWDRDPGW